MPRCSTSCPIKVWKSSSRRRRIPKRATGNPSRRSSSRTSKGLETSGKGWKQPFLFYDGFMRHVEGGTNLPRVSLRPLLLTDTPRLARYVSQIHWYRNTCAVRCHNRMSWRTPSAFARVCERNEQDGISLTRAIVAEDEFCGCIGTVFAFDVHACSAEVGYWIGRPYWGQGIASRAIGLMADLIFTQFPDIHRLYCNMFAENLASVRAAQKAGLRSAPPFPMRSSGTAS